MKTKKAVRADVDRLRGMFTKIGFALSLIVVIFAFKYTTEDKKSVSLLGSTIIENDDPIIDIYMPEKKIKPPQIATSIKQVDNNIEVDTSVTLQNPEFNERDSIVHNPIEIEIEPVDNTIYRWVDIHKPPSFPGGDEALYKFLNSIVNYPEPELSMGIQGSVTIEFVVNKDGSLSDFTIVKGVTPNLNEEALRVMKLLPAWNPGFQRDKAVFVRMSMPIRFSIQ